MKKGKGKIFMGYARRNWYRDRDIWLKSMPKEEDILNISRSRMFSDDITVEITIREIG